MQNEPFLKNKYHSSDQHYSSVCSVEYNNHLWYLVTASEGGCEKIIYIFIFENVPLPQNSLSSILIQEQKLREIFYHDII